MSAVKPNIVYILADDMGYGDMGCNNSESKIPTPNLDALAAGGMRFTDAHAASSVCTPSRYSILTGRYCWRTFLKRSVLWPWDPPLIEPERLTVAHLLRNNGYRCAAIGKWHLGWQWQTLDGQPANANTTPGEICPEFRGSLGDNIDYTKPMRGGPVDCGFDSYFGIDVPNFPPYTWFEDDHLAEAPTEDKPDEIFGWGGKMINNWRHEPMLPEFTRRAQDFIAASDDTPFFMYLALTSPHTPIAPNEQFIGKSGAGIYGDFVCETDWVVGQVVEALKDKGILENTLIIFTSDNGPECIAAAAGGAYEHARTFEHFSMGELRGVKRDTWEGGHRVPFIAHMPGTVPAGSTCDKLTLLSDLLATCADLTGAEVPEGDAQDSISILPLLTGEANATPRRAAIHHSSSGRFAVRYDNWVFIDAPNGDDNGEPQWFKQLRGYSDHDYPGELFDLSVDISQRRNMYGEKPELVEKLAAILNEAKAIGAATNRSHCDKEIDSE